MYNFKSGSYLAIAKRILPRVGNVQESIFILEVRIDLAHCGRRLRDSLVNEQENSFFGR